MPYALEQLGYVEVYKPDLQAASRAANELLSSNPNYADGYALAAHVLIYQGKPEEALQKTQEAINRDPKYPFFYDYHRGHAHYVWGLQTSPKNPADGRRHFEEAETHLRTALKKNNNFRSAHLYLVAVLSELKRRPEAVSEMATYRNMGGRTADRILPYKDEPIRRRLLERLRDAESGA